MRNINLWTIAACLACASSWANSQPINRCTVGGKTVYTDQACDGQVQRTIERARPAPTQGKSQADLQDEELARQHDQRLAQRDRDLESERIALQQQTNATNSECKRLKGERDGIQRMSLGQQQLDPWRSTLNRIRRRMNELHC